MLCFFIIIYTFLLYENTSLAEETEQDVKIINSPIPDIESIDEGLYYNVGDSLFSILNNEELPPKTKVELKNLFNENLQILKKIKQLSDEKNTNRPAGNATIPYINEKYLAKVEEKNPENSIEENSTQNEVGNVENTAEETEKEEENEEEKNKDEQNLSENTEGESEGETENSDKPSEEESKQEEAQEISGDDSNSEIEILDSLQSNDENLNEENETDFIQNEIIDGDTEFYPEDLRQFMNKRKYIEHNIIRNRNFNSKEIFPAKIDNINSSKEYLRNYSENKENIREINKEIDNMSEFIDGNIDVKKRKTLEKNLKINKLEELVDDVNNFSSEEEFDESNINENFENSENDNSVELTEPEDLSTSQGKLNLEKNKSLGKYIQNSEQNSMQERHSKLNTLNNIKENSPINSKVSEKIKDKEKRYSNSSGNNIPPNSKKTKNFKENSIHQNLFKDIKNSRVFSNNTDEISIQNKKESAILDSNATNPSRSIIDNTFSSNTQTWTENIPIAQTTISTGQSHNQIFNDFPLNQNSETSVNHLITNELSSKDF